MLVFGKKCPACGGMRLTATHKDSRITVLPGLKAYVCADCRQLMRYLFPFSVGVEHRQSSRKKLPSFFLVRLPGHPHSFARIKNISEGGICFDRHPETAPLAKAFFMLDLYNCNEGSALEQLPTRIVAISEQVVDTKNKSMKKTMDNNCARFIDLNQAQKKILHNCIAEYGMS